MPERGHPLVKEFFRRVNKEWLTLADLERRSGWNCAPWQSGESPNLQAFTDALQVLGLELRIMRKGAR